MPKFRIFSFWVTSITYYRTGNKHIQANGTVKILTISQCSYQFRTIVWRILKYKIIYSFDQGWMLNIPLRAELITGSQEIDIICTLTLIMSISGPSQKTPRHIKDQEIRWLVAEPPVTLVSLYLEFIINCEIRIILRDWFGGLLRCFNLKKNPNFQFQLFTFVIS